VVLAALVAARTRMGLDYALDAQPSLEALSRLDLAGFAEQPAVMGPLSVVLRAPFVALARALGWGPLGEYRLGAFACLVPCALIGILIARALTTRATAYAGAVLVALFAVNPLVFNALSTGHPEEPLAGALAVAAVVAIVRGRSLLGVVLLAAAVATKQSALVALGPALFALAPADRRRALLGLVVAAVVLLAPYALLRAGDFWALNVHLLEGSEATLPFSPWWLIADGPGSVRFVPDWVGPVGRVATLVVPLLLAGALAARRGGRLDADTALGLLAVAALLRCLLDPADNPYYHLPAVFALATWELQRRGGVPWLATAASAALWATIVFPWRSGHAELVAVLYLLGAVPLTVWLLVAVWRGQSSEDAGKTRRDVRAGY
jgi:hypothetical protein